MKTMKRLLVTMCIMAVLVAGFPLKKADAATKNVNKVLCQDKKISVKLKSIKNGKIILSVKFKTKKDGYFAIEYLSFNKKTYFKDNLDGIDMYGGMEREYKVEITDDNWNHVDYKFKGGKLQGKFRYEWYTDDSHSTFVSKYMKPFSKNI